MRDRLTDMGDAQVVVVTFTRPRNLRGFRARFVEPLTVVADEERGAYRAYGFDISEDTTEQQGGDVVVGRDGRIVLVHRSATSDDHPSVDALIAAMSGGGEKISP